MKDYKLSILIPARCEEWLSRTVQDILAHTSDETEVIVGLDGAWADPVIPDDPRVKLVYIPQSIGQRALTDVLCRLSRAKYVAKMDAHVALDQDWDQKMFKAFEKVGDNVTMLSIMRNLHIFNWICPDGHRRYQSPSGVCKEPGCGKETTKEVVWIPKQSPQSRSYSFDSSPHFGYFNDYCRRPEYQKMLEETGLTETMSIQGSCFMITRQKYWELDISGSGFGSWGSQGIQVACSTWLSGGRVMVNHATWYAHCFRTQGGDFSFPYPQSQRMVDIAKEHAKDLLMQNKWPKQIRPSSWLIEKFWPVRGWTDEDMANLKGIQWAPSNVPKRGIIFYTDNRLNLKIAHKVQKQLALIAAEKNMSIVSCSLKPMPHFGNKNIHLPNQPGILSYFRQILAALEASDAEIIFFCEHDVLYASEHFDFIPPTKDKFYYDHNFWKLRLEDGFAVHWDANQVSGLCCYRDLALDFYRKRVKEVEEGSFNGSYEPGRSTSITEAWSSPKSNIDIRHKGTMTKGKWCLADFKDKSTCVNWKEGYKIPGWGETSILIRQLG